MIITKDQVLEACKAIASAVKFDPLFIFAVALQEGAKEGNDFNPSAARLEQGFYVHYIERKLNLATTSEVLLSASYGVMQMMGESLKEIGYFDYFFNKQDDNAKKFLGNPLSQICIVQAIVQFSKVAPQTCVINKIRIRQREPIRRLPRFR